MPPTDARSRYRIYEEFASGGMASVHFGRLISEGGFSRRVAIKRMHDHFAKDTDFVSMFLDEARLAARIQHPNVVQTLDVVALEHELFIVLEYVHGVSLSWLVRTAQSQNKPIPVPVALSIMTGVLKGLHAAHRAKGDGGELLGIVHRDVSPQNVLVGADGYARLIDFGVAKARGKMRTTPAGEVMGKLGYAAPEQLTARGATRQSDIYSASVVLWELLTSQRLFPGDGDADTVGQVLNHVVAPPSAINPKVPIPIDAIVMRGVARDPARRFVYADEMADAIESTRCNGTASAVAQWVTSAAGSCIADREARFSQLEKTSVDLLPPLIPSPSPSPSPNALTPGPSPEGEGSPRPRRSLRIALALSASTALLLAVSVWFAARRSPVPLPNVAAASSTPLAVASELPSASAQPIQTGEIPDPPKQPRRNAATPPPRDTVSTSRKANCTPPYLVDSRGIQHIKPECL